MHFLHVFVVQDMSVYVRKVQFKLHESYPNPIRSGLKFKSDILLVYWYYRVLH